MKLLPGAFALTAVVLAAIAGYVLRTVTEDESTEPDVLAAELSLVRLQDYGQEYSIEVDYPQLGLPLDSQLRNLVETDAAELKKFAQSNPPRSTGASGSYSLTGGLTKAYLGSDIVSVGLVLRHYLGGAHGAAFAHGFTFDLKANREVTLDDALQMIDMSLEDLSSKAIAQLRTKPWFSPDFNPQGIAPDPKNFQTFTVTGDSVTFTFQEYQVGPYAIGLVEVSFPRSSRVD